MLDLEHFYLLDRPVEFSSSPWSIPGLAVETKQSMPFEQFKKIVGGRSFDTRDSVELELRLPGVKLSDMPVCDGPMHVVSPRLRALLEPYFGSSVESVKSPILDSSGNIHDYYLLSIKRGAGPKKLSKGASLFYYKMHSSIFPEYDSFELSDGYGIHFDISTWNGSNIFRLGDHGNQVIVTQAIADALRDSEFIGVNAIRLDLYGLDRWNDYQASGVSPF